MGSVFYIKIVADIIAIASYHRSLSVQNRTNRSRNNAVEIQISPAKKIAASRYGNRKFIGIVIHVSNEIGGAFRNVIGMLSLKRLFLVIRKFFMNAVRFIGRSNNNLSYQRAPACRFKHIP